MLVFAVDAAQERMDHIYKGSHPPLMKHMDLWEVSGLLVTGNPDHEYV